MKVTRSSRERMQALWQQAVARRMVDPSPVTGIRAPQMQPYEAHPVQALGKTQGITPLNAVRLDLDQLPPLFERLKRGRR